MNKLNCYAVPGERRCIALTPSCAFGLQGVIHVLRLPAFAVTSATAPAPLAPICNRCVKQHFRTDYKPARAKGVRARMPE